MICIKDPRDEKKEVATMEQQSGNGNYTREAADEPNVREKLTTESWQPVKKLASNSETGSLKKPVESKPVIERKLKPRISMQIINIMP